MTTTLVVPWVGANAIGLQPQDPFDSDSKPFTVGWKPRLSTVWIHFDPQDLTVKAGAGPDPVTATGATGPGDAGAGSVPGGATPGGGTAPGSGAAGAGSAGPGAAAPTASSPGTVRPGPVTVSPQLRPHPLVVRVAPRKEPAFLRKMGLGVTLVLDAPATVTVVLVRPKAKGVRRVKVTRTAHKRLPAGRTRIRLRLSDTGRVLTRRRLTVTTLEVTVAYADGTQAHVTRPLRIART